MAGQSADQRELTFAAIETTTDGHGWTLILEHCSCPLNRLNKRKGATVPDRG